MPPEENTYDDGLIVQNNSNYLIADSEIAFNREKDLQREKVIRSISLESNFYNVFRNSIKVLISDAKNMKTRESIQTIINDDEILYTDKLKNVITILKQLTQDMIYFTEYKQEILDEIETITGCINNEEDSCADKKFCLVSKEGKCQLLIPKHNLITGNNNEVIYYGRMADELVRYNRIKHFMFNPNDFLTFTNIGYNLLPTEVILLQSLLTQEYFDDMVPVIKNPYVTFNTYDTAQPFLTQAYDKRQVKEFEDTSQVCTPSKKPTVSGKWKTMLPSNAHEFIFGATPACSFEMMVMIVNNHTGTSVDSFLLKKILLEQYYKYIKDYKNEVMAILTNEGKKLFTHQLYYNQITLETLIISESYYLTNFDIWLISDVYKLPVIMLSSTMLREYNDNILVTMRSDNDKYYVIKSPGVQANTPGKYRLIAQPGAKIQIEMSDFPSNMSHLITDIVNDTNTSHNRVVTLEEYLRDFKYDKPKKKAPKRIKILGTTKKPDETSEVIAQIDPPVSTAVDIPLAKKVKKVGRIKLRPKQAESVEAEYVEAQPDVNEPETSIGETSVVPQDEIKLLTPEQEEELLLSKALIQPPAPDASRKPAFSKIKIKPLSSVEETPQLQQIVNVTEVLPDPSVKRSESVKKPFKSIRIKPRSTIETPLVEEPIIKKKTPSARKIKIKPTISTKSPLSLDNLITETSPSGTD